MSKKTQAELDKELVEKINDLSPAAYYLCGLHNFGIVMMGKPVLMAINYKASEENIKMQEDAWDELLEAGFCHGDVERGVYGYRSTWNGQRACAMIRQHEGRVDGAFG